MTINEAPATRTMTLRSYSYILIAAWSATILGLLFWGIARTAADTRRIATNVARAHFDKDRAIRLWAASHGGVYVPVDDRTFPSPYLEHFAERDLETPSGKKLTLMNPAYMVRQLHEDFAELYGVNGHLTSLRPMRPENRPDDWEKGALEGFERGDQEATEFTEIDGKPYLRFIKPLHAEKDCLKCHGDYYKEGDIRGGVGIALPLSNLIEIQRREIVTQIISHGSIFFVGLVGIVFGVRRLEKHEADRNRAQEALRASERKYRALFNDSADGVFITSRAGELLEANQSLLDMFGYSTEEIVGTDVHRFYEDSFDRAKFQAAVESIGAVRGYEVRLRKKDGTLLDCIVTGNVRLGEDGAIVGYQGIVRDVTQQKRSAESLQKQAQELERSNADLEQFAFVVSHDLQEPLRNVAGCVQLLEKRCQGKLGSDADRLMGYALESVVRMKDLIKDLLAYSRVGTKGRPFEPTDCEEVVVEAKRNLASSMGQAGAIVTHDTLPTIQADPVQLAQVFQNLIGNAIKFHRKGEPPIVRVSAVEDQNRWTFSVRDNGIGIESRHLDRIFMVFQRLHGKTEYEGTGIGLAIVKKIVDRHGGRVQVESELGVGTTFHFTIPK